MAETWWQYLERITDGARQTAISRAAGVDKSTVWRWKADKATPSPEAAIRLARAYGRPVAEALVASGAITAEEASITEVARENTPADLDDDELIEEVRRRMQRASHNP
jgi:transcriptional regulator with XRE-family HTH domain